jgi:hypothetical protein
LRGGAGPPSQGANRGGGSSLDRGVLIGDVEGSSSFLKKRTKKLLLVDPQVVSSHG